MPQHQFFLTPEEDSRIRKTIEDRLQQCRVVEGKPRQARDYGSLRSQAVQESLFADMAGSAGEQTMEKMVTLAVGSPYPPCVVSSSCLQPIKLAELRMHTHHRGRILRLRREAPVVVYTARSWTVVQDQDGTSNDAERLELVLHKNNANEEVLEMAKRFLVCEPFMTFNEQGEQAICVNHPSDLIVCRSTASEAKTAEQQKKEGNAALKSKEFLDAHTAYTLGLKIACSSDDDAAKDLYRNRAFVNLQLQRYDEAKADAIAAVTAIDDEKHRSLDSKAYFRAGCAAYGLGDWHEARRLFMEQLSVAPRDKDGLAYLRKIAQRLRERDFGQYDFARIKTSLSTKQSRPKLDTASFIANTEVKCSPDAGRGLFARRDFRPGELIFCDKAFSAVFGHVDEAWTALTIDARDDYTRGFPAGLHKALVQKLLNNPSQVEQCLQLYSDYEGVGKKLVCTDNGPVIDTFQIHDIICRNAFGASPQYGDEDVMNASTGLWVWASYVNHSCIPNARKEILGDLMVVRASVPISAGDEITLSYDVTSDYDVRQASLMKTWNFCCSCRLCKVQATEDPDMRRRRADLERQVGALLKNEQPARAKRLTVVKARRLADAIAQTYPEGIYEGLPKTALDGLKEWLALAKIK